MAATTSRLFCVSEKMRLGGHAAGQGGGARFVSFSTACIISIALITGIAVLLMTLSSGQLHVD